MPHVDAGRPSWTPSPERVQASRLHAFTERLAARGLPVGEHYDDLWRWSVTDLDGFWDAVRAEFEVPFSAPPTAVLAQ